MAATIQPLQIPEYSAAAPSAFDFAPLAKLGEALQQKRLQDQQQSLAALAPAASAAGTAPSVFDTGSGASYSRKGSGDYGGAIANIESGGRYDLLGPVTKTGDRAYGKYQMMGNNIPQWSQAALGRSVSPQEFLANPSLQDTVFKHRFGQYVDKYGPGGAARAWFAGEGGMNNPNAKDQLGTSVASYERRFLGGL
jgi:hypothetical protein